MKRHECEYTRSKPNATVETCACGKFRHTEHNTNPIIAGRDSYDELTDEQRQRAEQAIEEEQQVCFDVAAEYGQIFGNVKHMRWFVAAIAAELEGGNDVTQ